MGTYKFQAKTLQGKVVSGSLEASNEAEARVIIRAQKLIPVKVAAGTKSKKSSGSGKSEAFSFMGDSISPKDLQIFTRQFAVLVGAGVPIVQALQALSGGGRSPSMGRALKAVLAEVEKGKRLGDSLAAQPRAFDRLYVNLVKAGEEGGVLDIVLNRLAEYIETSVKLKGKITGALWYPAVVIVIAALVICGIMIFVIPQFTEMFSSMGQDLPALTVFVVDSSHFVAEKWYILLSVAVLVPFSLKLYYGTDNGRKQLDPIILKIPVFGNLINKGSIARASRTLSTLLSAGVRIMEALEIAAATSGNWVIESALLRSKEMVAKGKSLTEPLTKENIFPDMVIQMIAVGEQTGNLDAMLGKIADFYEDEVETAAETLTSLIEPLLMVGLGGVIAVIVIAMYLPIFNMAGAIGN